MSYILDALGKMEKQKARDSEKESWVNDLSVDSEEDRKHHKRSSKVIVGVSIFFGICGIVGGLLLNSNGGNQERIAEEVILKEKPILNTEPVMPDKRTGSTILGKDKINAEKPISIAEAEKELKEKKDVATIEDQTPYQPPVIPGPKPENIHEIKATLSGRQDTKKKIIVQNKNRQDGIVEKPATKMQKMIDLTGRYRLTSTGKVDGKKYATIEGNDYFIGDSFKNMVVKDIGKDRVFFAGKEGNKDYIIIFRYRK